MLGAARICNHRNVGGLLLLARNGAEERHVRPVLDVVRPVLPRCDRRNLRVLACRIPALRSRRRPGIREARFAFARRARALNALAALRAMPPPLKVHSRH